jgi:phosphoglycolate phosphatase
MPRRFDLLVFDWDGTLADSTAIIVRALQNACRDLGCAVPDDVAARYVIGLGLVDALRHVAPALDAEHYPRLSSRYREHYLAREAEIPLFEGVRELLSDLRDSGHRLAIATGKSRPGLDRALAFHGLVGAFDVTRCADEGMPKPHPDMLHHLMRATGTPAAATVMIGDTTHDLQMAANAGVAAIAVAHGAHGVEELGAATNIAIARSVSELRVALLSR